MASFIFVRHGESQANASGLIATLDSPLTDKGKEQAHKTGLELKGKGIDTILCSPLTRAKQTAEVIAKELGISTKNIEIVDELQERINPSLEGKPKNHPTVWYLTNDDPSSEPREELLARTKIALEKVRNLSKKHNKVLVVSHGVSGYFLVQAALGKSSVADFEPPSQLINADFLEIKL